MREFAVYTAARLAVFVVTYGLVVGVYLLVSGSETVPLVWPFLVAVVVSAIVSVVFLRKQREAFALAVQRRAERTSARLERARAKEDAEDERHRSSEDPPDR